MRSARVDTAAGVQRADERKDWAARAPRARVMPQSPSPTTVSCWVMVCSEDMTFVQPWERAALKAGRSTGGRSLVFCYLAYVERAKKLLTL